jgi:hypothetical protein
VSLSERDAGGLPDRLGRELFSLAEDFGVGVRDGDADEFLIGVQPEVPVRAFGLHHEVAEALGTAIERGIVVSLELDEDLRGGMAAGNQDGKASAFQVAAVAAGAGLASRGKVSPEKDFTGGKEIVVEDKGFLRQEEGLVGGFAVGSDVHGEELIAGFDNGGAAHGGELLPLIAGKAAVGKQRQFAGLLNFAVGLGGFAVELRGGHAGVRVLADGEGLGGDALAVLEDAERALINDGGRLGGGRLAAGEQGCGKYDEQGNEESPSHG